MLYRYNGSAECNITGFIIKVDNIIAVTGDHQIFNYTTGILSRPIPESLLEDVLNHSILICNQEFDITLYNEFRRLGLIGSNIRVHNEGNSNYSQHVIQPWSIWIDYNLNPWDADIVKRILRTKKESGMSETESRILDYKKIIHICQERIRQLENC